MSANNRYGSEHPSRETRRASRKGVFRGMRSFALLISALLLISTLFCIPSPSLARTRNADTWTGAIIPAEQPAALESDLLLPGGQTVLLNKRENGVSIPVTVTANEDIEATLTVTVSDPDWFTVLPGEEPLSLTKGETRTVELTVTMISVKNDPFGADQTQPETAEETGTAEGPEDPGQAGTEGVSDEKPDVSQEEDAKTPPSKLSFDVTLTYGGGSLEAKFEMENEQDKAAEFLENSEQFNGVLVDPPGWYSASHPLFLTVDDRARIHFSQGEEEKHGFPAMTGYEFGGQKYLLYDSSSIYLSEGGELILDLSETGISGSFTLSTDASVCEFSELGSIRDASSGTAIVAIDGGAGAGVTYEWGGISPTFSASVLSAGQDGGFVWTPTDRVSCAASADGEAYIDAATAPAGTYKAELSWVLNGKVLYSTEVVFFVQHRSGGQ